jgi:hypothetical protein
MIAMKIFEFRKANHLAIIGFLLPFVSAGVTGLLVLVAGKDMAQLRFSILYLTLVPLILLAGLISSLKSIPQIEERGDRDYAYSGMALNFIFSLVYIFSLIFLFRGSFS